MIEPKQLIAFLDRIHLFNGLTEEDLAGIAAKVEERALPADTIVFKRGDKPDGFYLIYKGRVKVTRPRERGEDFLAWLGPSDYFGEEALFENRNRSATIQTVENSTLLFLSRSHFEDLIKKYDKLKPNFEVAIKSRKLARATRFKWLGENEVIYFIARRHRIRLYQVLLAPLFALIVPALLFAAWTLMGAVIPLALGVVLMFLIVLWAVWRGIDWSNDYYIVTNQRVVWLERVIGVYDSRQEAPLSTILSVGVETDMLGRALDYGHITVRTFVGNIRFEYVDHPDQAAELIRELWERSKSRGVQAQKEAMKNALRAKLGLPLKKLPEEALPPVVPEDKTVQKKGLFRIALSNLFKLRTEEGGTVIYHKHWIVLLQQISRPLTFFGILLALIFFRMWLLYQDPDNVLLRWVGWRPVFDATILAFLALMLPFIGWMIWEFIDWSNDIFKVTPEEIIDIDKTPLGSEERRAAQIENILSTEYKRVGLLGYLFNYGTVFISVGGTKLTFQDVLDPAGVQADINRRRIARLARKNEETANIERERMATWLAAYHQNLGEFNTAPTSAQPPAENDVTRLTRAGLQIDDEDIESGDFENLEGGLDDGAMGGAEG